MQIIYICFLKFLLFSSWYGTVCGVYCPGATSQSQGLHPAAGGTAGVWCFLGRWKKTKHLNIYISWYQTNVCAISFWKKYFELLLLSSVGIKITGTHFLIERYVCLLDRWNKLIDVLGIYISHDIWSLCRWKNNQPLLSLDPHPLFNCSFPDWKICTS